MDALNNHMCISPIFVGHQNYKRPPLYHNFAMTLYRRQKGILNASSTEYLLSDSIQKATETLEYYDKLQLSFVKDNSSVMGGGTAALQFLRNKVTKGYREEIKNAIMTLVGIAHAERTANSAHGRVMLGICAENVPEALLGLKTWMWVDQS